MFTSSFLNVDQNVERFMIYHTAMHSTQIINQMIQMMTKSSLTKAEDDSTIITGQKRKFKGVCNRCGNQGHKSREFAEIRVIHNAQQSTNNAVSLLVAALPQAYFHPRVATQDKTTWTNFLEHQLPSQWVRIDRDTQDVCYGRTINIE